MRKKIAVLLSQIDETTQNKFLTGFVEEAYSYDYDVCVFAPFQKYQMTPKRDLGDSNIFNLINYDAFDAMVLLSDTILSKGGFVNQLHKTIKEKFNGPVLVVDKENEYFETIMMDHYSPFRKIVDHVIEVDGYRDIAFLGGKEGHPHSVMRYNAFVDSMKAHNIPINDKWVYHGNYWYNTAVDFANILMQDKEHLPRVVICANDIMAIGIASRFSECGYRIPQDIAITGYDSIEAGRLSPSPLTSAHIPSDECGAYCVRWVDAKLQGKQIEPFKSNASVFLGASCGCDYEVEMIPKELRSNWKTPQSSGSMFSDFDHMAEDLLAQTRITEFLKLVAHYSYQIKPFHSFDICFNDGFMTADTFVGEKAIRGEYTQQMHMVLSCQEDGNVVDLDNKFDTSIMSPRLLEERDYPTAYIFNPIYSEDRCYGYTVLNYGREPRVNDERLRIWMRDVMQGIEAFYRQRYMLALVEKIQADQVRDSLTGLYNYEGFLRFTKEMINKNTNEDAYLSVIAMDIKGVQQINEIFGRDEGKRAISAVGFFVQNNVYEHEVACRMCNDEFLVALFDDKDSTRTKKIMENINKKLSKYNNSSAVQYDIKLHHTSLSEFNFEAGSLESLVNQVITVKNHMKYNAGGDNKADSLKDEVKRNQMVMDVLNKNLFTYHYQPIVNAKDGSIYAYEALMRCETKKLSPLQILQSASYLDRLNDVEKCTLLNVTSDVADRIDMFGGAKVFINSLPGIVLSEEDEQEFASRLMGNNGRFVIEFTEESQLTDVELQNQKAKYNRYGCKIAIDDYGSGYSNVNNLLRYMPQYVKIDRMLITDIQDNPQKQHFVKSIIGFAHDNNILALAEGVETQEEMYECMRLGVDLIQGYYTGRPQRDPIGEVSDEIKAQIESFRADDMGWRLA